jgi:hypothetical protein
MQPLVAVLDEILRSYTVTLAALALMAIFAIRARRQQGAVSEATGSRLRWYWPVYVAGFQSIGGIQSALRCHGVVVDAQASLNVARTCIVGAALVIAAATFAAWAIERVASPLRQRTFIPLPVLAAVCGVVLNLALVTHLFGDVIWKA